MDIELKKASTITKAYPNPFDNELTLEYEASEDLQDASVRVFDGTGNIVFENKLIGADGLEKLSLGHLKSGFYLVQINNAKAVKVIKQ